jgi:hypothetical protein
MAITRFALSNPDANTDTLIYTADRQSVSSVIATNKSVNDVTMRVWVVPQGATTESEYAYLSYDAIIPPQNSLETFRFSFTSQDKLYVRASSAEVSFYLNGIYESVGNQFVTVSSTAPSSPTIGDVWVNDTNDSVYFWDGTIWVNVQSQAQSYVQDEPPSLPAEGSIWLDSNSTANAVDGGYPTVIYTASEPTGLDITDTGTVWIDSGTNEFYVWDGSAFILTTAPASSYQSTAPSSPITGQIWVDSDDGLIYVWNGSSWEAVGGGGATGGGSDKVFIENDQIITTSYTITSGKNAMTTGPITIDSGILVTIPSGSVWSII